MRSSWLSRPSSTLRLPSSRRRKSPSTKALSLHLYAGHQSSDNGKSVSSGALTSANRVQPVRKAQMLIVARSPCLSCADVCVRGTEGHLPRHGVLHPSSTPTKPNNPIDSPVIHFSAPHRADHVYLQSSRPPRVVSPSLHGGPRPSDSWSELWPMVSSIARPYVSLGAPRVCVHSIRRVPAVFPRDSALQALGQIRRRLTKSRGHFHPLLQRLTSKVEHRSAPSEDNSLNLNRSLAASSNLRSRRRD